MTLSANTLWLPAEWAPQAGVLLTWPHAGGDWQPWLAQAERTFAELGARISRFETLVVVCCNAAHEAQVQSLLRAAGAHLERVRCYSVPSNDTWARDHGPLTVYRGGRPVLLDFRFNGWGGKFAYELDDRITERLHALGAFGATPCERVELILEGGSIESDGRGTLLTTRRCLLAANRNGLSQPALEGRLAEWLGIRRFLWLEHGQLLGDDTDGHIDTLVRFCDPDTLAYQGCRDESDGHFDALQAMQEELRGLRTAAGRPYRLIELPLPAARFEAGGERWLPAGYANFLILNGAVLVPTYADPADGLALEKLRDCFPGREIIGVDCRTLIQQYGSLHCVTMQLPEGVLPDGS